jgi:hypothetical protein
VVKLGTIQDVTIYTEGEKLETIWFVQKRIRNVDYKKLKKRNFKISNILIEKGYDIPNPEEFDRALKNLFEKVVPEKFPHLLVVHSKST